MMDVLKGDKIMKSVVVYCPSCNGQIYAVYPEYINNERMNEIGEYIKQGYTVATIDSKNVTMEGCRCDKRQGGDSDANHYLRR